MTLLQGIWAHQVFFIYTLRGDHKTQAATGTAFEVFFIWPKPVLPTSSQTVEQLAHPGCPFNANKVTI